jgi:hypothetical protein
MLAAAAYAYVAGRKVAGVHDHWSSQDLAIAAECRGGQLQGFDGDRGAPFGGALPELYDAGDKAFVTMEVAGAQVRGFDRGSSSHYAGTVAGQQVQIYDYSQDAWFAFDILVVE